MAATLGGGKFEDITKAIPVVALERPHQHHRLVRRHRQRRRPGPLRHRPCARAMRSSKTTGGGRVHATSPRDLRAWATRGTASSAVLFDYDRDGLLDLFLTNVGQYTSEKVVTAAKQGFRGDVEDYHYFEGFTGRLQPATSKPRATSRGTCYPQKHRRHQRVRGRLGEGRARSIPGLVRRGDPARPQRGRVAPISTSCSMQGHDKYFENVGGERFEDNRRTRVFPAHAVGGTMGVKVVRLRQRRATWTSSSPTCTRTWSTTCWSNAAPLVRREEEDDGHAVARVDAAVTDRRATSVWGNAFFQQPRRRHLRARSPTRSARRTTGPGG